MENKYEQSQTLSRLYTLRAGLSVICNEKDKADNILNIAKNKADKTLVDANAKIDRAKKAISAATEELENAQSIENRDLEEAGKGGDIAKGKIKYLFASLLFLILTAVCASVVAYIITYFCFEGGVFNESWRENKFLFTLYDWLLTESKSNPGHFEAKLQFAGWFFPVSLVALVACLAGTGSFFSLFFKSIFCFFSTENIRLLSKAKKRRANNRANVITAENGLQNANNLLALREREYQDAVDSTKNELAKEKSKAGEHVKIGLALVNSLNNTFGDLIDYRDWCNIDLLIYLIETRRADTIKEALLLADKERRTERIIQAVTDASREISRTIDVSIGRLQNDMRKCFNVLSEQMALQTEAILSEMSSLSAHTASLSAQISSQAQYISQLTTSTNMNNALLAKANETSYKLADDVNQLRTNSDYVSMRLRNGM